MKLKAYRIRNNMTQAQLAGISGISQSVIAEIESGKRANPRIKTVFRLSRALGCKIEDLISDQEKQCCTMQKTMQGDSKGVVGDRIHSVRKELHVSQIELSKKSGVSQAAISSIEQGKKNPSVETLCMIADALGRSPAFFIAKNEDPVTLECDGLRNEVLYLYDHLSESGKEKVLSYLRFVSEYDNQK